MASTRVSCPASSSAARNSVRELDHVTPVPGLTGRPVRELCNASPVVVLTDQGTKRT